MKAQDLQPGHVVRIAFNRTATVNATLPLGERIQVEWQEPYEPYYYLAADEVDVQDAQ